MRLRMEELPTDGFVSAPIKASMCRKLVGAVEYVRLMVVSDPSIPVSPEK